MGKTFFCADLHLGHARIIEYSKRPFTTLNEMDEKLIANWNQVVGPDDEVWFLGDFCFKGGASQYLARLNGRNLHLIWGNHDDEETTTNPRWASSQPYAEIAVEGQKLVLFHYALRVWNRSASGSIHLYGHSHGRLPGDSQSVDVGVDNGWNYHPIDLRAIRQRLRTHPPRGPEPDHDG